MDMEGELVLKEVHFPLAKDCLNSLQLADLGPCCSSGFLLFPGSGWSFLAYFLGAWAHFVPLALTTAAVEEENWVSMWVLSRKGTYLAYLSILSFSFPPSCSVHSVQHSGAGRVSYRGGHFYIVMPWPLLSLLVTPWELLFHWLLIMLFLHKDRVDTSPLKWMVGWSFAWHDPSSFFNSGQLFMMKLMGTRYQ